MNTFDPVSEKMSRSLMEQVQLERLQTLLARLKRNVPRYRALLGTQRIESMSDLDRIPMTAPQDLAAAFPYGMFALPLREVIRLDSAMGPDGMQLVVGHTRNDLAQWARLAARQLVAAGVTPHDVLQIGFGGGAFRQGLGYLLGAELIEASVVPQDAYHVEYQLAMMQSYRVSVLVTTPANAHELIRILDERQIDPQSLQLRAVLLSRPVPSSERDDLKRGLFTDVHCSFGVPEVLDPGLCVECSEGHFHVNEDHFLVEIKSGEIVVTTLTREAMPLVRYRTRIAGSFGDARCPCGRTGAVLCPGARLDGRLRVNEMPLYRVQVETVLGQTRAAGHDFRLDISDQRVGVAIKVTEKLFPDTIRELEKLKAEIESELLSRLGIRSEVSFFGAGDFGSRVVQGE